MKHGGINLSKMASFFVIFSSEVSTSSTRLFLFYTQAPVLRDREALYMQLPGPPPEFFRPAATDQQIRWMYSTFFFLFWCKIILCFILLMEKLNCNNTRLWGKHVVRKMPLQSLFNEKILTIYVFMPMAFERQYDKKLAVINTYLITLFSCFSNISLQRWRRTS